MHPTAAATVGVGPRTLAFIIDVVAFVVVLCPFIIILAVAGAFDTDADTTSGAELALNCLSTILYLAYYIVMEAIFGATLGKMAIGLRVVKEDGTRIEWTDSIVRNLLRIVDGLFVYLVGAILVWTSPLKQRLGDRLAKTVVVRKEQVEEFASPTSRF